MRDWLLATQILQQIVQTAAIAVAALWAYFKFVRGRTFAYRLELTMESRLTWSASRCYLHATVTVRNNGQSRVPLHSDPHLAALAVRSTAADGWSCGFPPDWGEPLHVEKILTSHTAIEPAEVIVEDVVVPLPAEAAREWAALRIEAQVWADRSFWRREWQVLGRSRNNGTSFLPRRNHRWTTVRVLPVEGESG